MVLDRPPRIQFHRDRTIDPQEPARIPEETRFITKEQALGQYRKFQDLRDKARDILSVLDRMGDQLLLPVPTENESIRMAVIRQDGENVPDGSVISWELYKKAIDEINKRSQNYSRDLT